MFSKYEIPVRSRLFMKRLSMLIAAAVLAGCQDQSPIGIESRLAATGGERHAMVSVDQADARVAIDDVVDRIVPALTDAAGARQVGAALKGLQQALNAGQAADGPALAGVAQAAVERYASLGNGDAAEVDAIRLALAVVLGTD
jgi:hypothetical protein